MTTKLAVSCESSQNHQTENMVMAPVGLGIKTHCAGEAQQQFSSQSTAIPHS
jgi:hypothetical protein